VLIAVSSNLIIACMQIIPMHTSAATTTKRYFEGQLKLITTDPNPNQSTSKGMLQVYLNKEWTPVCNETFGDDEADSSCRQLGYTSALRYGIADNNEYRLAAI